MRQIAKRTLLYSAEQIQQRVSEIAAEVNALYAGEPLVVICVLKGGFMFFADLVKQLTVKPSLDFVRLASYGKSAVSTRAINFTKDVEIPLEGKHVLVVEDVVDTGHSMQFLTKVLEARSPRSIRIATMVDKAERRETDVHVDFVGFALDKGYIVGYGLDYAEQYRELDSIYCLNF